MSAGKRWRKGHKPQTPAEQERKDWNVRLYKDALAVWRGLYMETPKTKPNGQPERNRSGAITYHWGKKIHYCGSFKGRTLLTIALEKWEVAGCPAPEPKLGEYLKRCAGCGQGFVSTRSDALTCDAKCRKRLSRKQHSSQ
jgi:hypothetical protein